MTPQRTWAQVQSKVHKMRKKFNQLKQEHGESGANGHGLSDMIGARLPNLFLRNCVEGRERKFDGAAKKVGRLGVHVRILSACFPFCQRISRSRQAEAKVFNIMCATQEMADAKAKDLLLDESPKPSSLLQCTRRSSFL